MGALFHNQVDLRLVAICIVRDNMLVSPVLTHHEEFALVDSDPVNYFWNDIGQALHWGKMITLAFTTTIVLLDYRNSFASPAMG